MSRNEKVEVMNLYRTSMKKSTGILIHAVAFLSVLGVFNAQLLIVLDVITFMP